MLLLKRFMEYKQGAVAPKRTWGPSFIFQNSNFRIIETINKQSLTKISVQVLFQWNDLKYGYHPSLQVQRLWLDADEISLLVRTLGPCQTATKPLC